MAIVEINDKYVYDLQFVGGASISGAGQRRSEHKTRKIYEEYGKWGMKMNTEKIKYLCIWKPN